MLVPSAEGRDPGAVGLDGTRQQRGRAHRRLRSDPLSIRSRVRDQVAIHKERLEQKRAQLDDALTLAKAPALSQKVARFLASRNERSSAPLIVVSNAHQISFLELEEFERFVFTRPSDLSIIFGEPKPDLVTTLDGCVHLSIAPGRSIRVPPRVDLFEYRGFKLPAHLVLLTGGGPDTWESIGQAHVRNHRKFMGIDPGMTFLEVGCGIGRDTFALFDALGPNGRYIGTDVTRDSILWCQENLSKAHPNFFFHHIDARHELYNPLGTRTSLDFSLPAEDRSVDRIALGSIFTHLMEQEVAHYLKEIARVLKEDGLAYATFFWYSEDAIESARKTDLTPFKLRFDHAHADGCYVNDLACVTAAVAYTAPKMQRLIDDAGLKLHRPFLRGAWSGAFSECADGQDVALLRHA
jgi:SAM-dependent methyltransferase